MPNSSTSTRLACHRRADGGHLHAGFGGAQAAPHHQRESGSVNEPSGARPFGKYERFGAYHWREIQRHPARHNAVLTARYAILLAAVDPSPGRVLDIGCGDGTLTFALAKRSASVYGIDDSLLPLRLARGEFKRRDLTHPPRLARADARRLPFPEGAFDCVVLADVIEHIDTPELVVREAHRVLRRGGQLLVTTPRRQEAGAIHEYHCREYTASELADVLGSSFAAVEVRAFQPKFFARLYDQRVLGRKLFRLAINCFSALGWNPLAASDNRSAEIRYTDLCACARKS